MRSSLLLFFFLLACDGPSELDAGADARIENDAGTDASTPSLVWEPCPIATGTTGDEAECTMLDVPLDHTAPDGRHIEIFVKRLPAIEPRRGALILVNGGVVSSSVDLEAALTGFFAPKVPDFDIYLLDHRGTGRSSRLGCPDAEAAGSIEGSRIAPEEAAACQASLRQEWGEDLDRFSTTEAARDLVELVDRIRERDGGAIYFYGISYGSLLVQRYLRLAPEGADGVILDGTCAPGGCTMSELDRSMDALAVRFFDECATDDFCRARLGDDPAGALRALLDDLEAGHCSDAAALGFTPTAVRALIANVLGYAGWTMRPATAAMVHRLRRCEPRDVASLEILARSFFATAPPPISTAYASEATGFNISFVELWEDPPPSIEELRAIHDDSHASNGGSVHFARAREEWTFSAGDEHRHRFADTEVPMLILHGTFDFVSDASAETARDHYTAPNHTYVAIPRAPHASIFAPTNGGRGCAGNLMDQFFADPRADIDASCASDIAPIDWDSIGTYAVPLFGTADFWDGEP